MKTITKFAAIGVVTMASLAPQTASALDFTFEGPVTSPFLNVSGTRDGTNYSVNAGAFDFSDDDGVLADFVAWCFDLATTFNFGSSYEYTEAPNLLDDTPPYKAGARDRVQDLFDVHYDLSTTGVTSTAAKSAGFQIAIWEVLYDNDFSLTAGDFTATGGNSGALSEAATFLSGVSGYGGSEKWALTIYDGSDVDPKAQDIGVATAIPLPAAAWLLMFASGGLLAAKRRQAKKAA